MLISEVCKKLDITKKAISYYEKLGLVKIRKDDNGYRCFSEVDIKKLREIMLYRKLEVSSSVIQELLHSDKKESILHDILKMKNQSIRYALMQEHCLRKLVNSKISETSIREAISYLEKKEHEEQDFVFMKLKEAFPGWLGNYIASHFSTFEFEQIENEEQHKAWNTIIAYLDRADTMNIPESIENILDEMDNESMNAMQLKMKKEVMERSINDEELKVLAGKQDKNFRDMETELPDLYRDYIDFTSSMRSLFESEEYQLHVTQNMRILSHEYNKYYESLVELAKSSKL